MFDSVTMIGSVWVLFTVCFHDCLGLFLTNCLLLKRVVVWASGGMCLWECRLVDSFVSLNSPSMSPC